MWIYYYDGSSGKCGYTTRSIRGARYSQCKQRGPRGHRVGIACCTAVVVPIYSYGSGRMGKVGIVVYGKITIDGKVTSRHD